MASFWPVSTGFFPPAPSNDAPGREGLARGATHYSRTPSVGRGRPPGGSDSGGREPRPVRGSGSPEADGVDAYGQQSHCHREHHGIQGDPPVTARVGSNAAGRALLDTLPLAPADVAKIAGGNAERVLGLVAPHRTSRA